MTIDTATRASASPPDIQHQARQLLALHGGDLASTLDHVERQFGVIQSRSQFLLTIGTLTLTITGFSGPAIARSGLVSRWGLALGLILVLTALVLLLLGSLRIRWLTHFISDDAQATIAQAIAWRDQRARRFTTQLLLLVLGLGCYVVALIWFMLNGGDRS